MKYKDLTQVPMSSESELHQLFARRKPDAGAFRTGIDARIAELEADDDLDGGEAGGEPKAPSKLRAVPQWGSTHSPFMNKAASFMPLALAGKTLKASPLIKLTYSTLALPAMIVALVVGSFAASVRSLRHQSKNAVPGGMSQSQANSTSLPMLNRDLRWAQLLTGAVHMGTVMAFVLGFFLGNQAANRSLVFALLIAMASVVLAVRGMAKAGILSRGQVALMSFAQLNAVYLGCFLWMVSFGFSSGRASTSFAYMSVTVLIGTTISIYYAWQGKARWAPFLGTVATMLLLVPIGGMRSSPASLYGQLEGLSLSPGDLSNWETAGLMFAALQDIGEATPTFGDLGDQLEVAIRRHDDLHPVVYTSATHMGLIDSELWKVMAEEPMNQRAIRGLLDDAHHKPIGPNYHEFQLHMLLASEDLSTRQHERLLALVESWWQADFSHAALETMVTLAHDFDLLGRPDLADAHRDQVHEMLVANWVQQDELDSFSSAGGFTPSPAKYHRSFVDATSAAVSLMARFGVPEEIDPWLVRGYLREEARAYPPFLEYTARNLKGDSRAALLRFNRQVERPKLSILERIAADSLFLAALLLVSLCLLAIRLAPPFPEGEGGGAQP